MTALIADVGGTNTRAALADASAPEHVRHFANADFKDAGELLTAFLQALPTTEKPERVLLAVAAPIRGRSVRMTNLDWDISADSLADQLGVAEVCLLNDFEALACAVPTLKADALLQVGGGPGTAGAARAVIGPGTGLGLAGLVHTAAGWQAVAGEGGHASLAACDAQEEGIIRAVRERFGHCSTERLVSGPGLALIHELLHGGRPQSPADIGDQLAAGENKAKASFEQFCRFLGTAAADAALTFGARGGVYLGGGIIPRHTTRFIESGFRQRFENKGRYAGYLAEIPSFVICAEDPTLIGLATLAGRDRPGD